jgi:hypothetical protein
VREYEEVTPEHGKEVGKVFDRDAVQRCDRELLALALRPNGRFLGEVEHLAEDLGAFGQPGAVHREALTAVEKVQVWLLRKLLLI